MDQSAQTGPHSGATTVLASAGTPEEMVSNTAALVASLDLMAAHLAVHALNGILLELSKAGLGLAVNGTPIGAALAEVWTATLRSDIDGPGGVYALITPASLVRKMPSWRPVHHDPCPDRPAVAQRLSGALAAVAATHVPIAVRTSRSQVVAIATPDAVVGRQHAIILDAGRTAKTPVALRLS